MRKKDLMQLLSSVPEDMELEFIKRHPHGETIIDCYGAEKAQECEYIEDPALDKFHQEVVSDPSWFTRVHPEFKPKFVLKPKRCKIYFE